MTEKVYIVDLNCSSGMIGVFSTMKKAQDYADKLDWVGRWDIEIKAHDVDNRTELLQVIEVHITRNGIIDRTYRYMTPANAIEEVKYRPYFGEIEMITVVQTDSESKAIEIAQRRCNEAIASGTWGNADN